MINVFSITHRDARPGRDNLIDAQGRVVATVTRSGRVQVNGQDVPSQDAAACRQRLREVPSLPIR